MLPLILTALAGIALAIGAFFLGRSLGTSETAAAEQAKQQQERTRLEQERSAAVAAATFEQIRKHEDKLRGALAVSGQSFDDMLVDAKSKFSTAAGDQDAVKKLTDENGKLRVFYDAEKSHHRDRVKELRAQIATFAGELDTRSLPAAQKRLAALQADLKAVRDQWPWTDKDDAAWLGDLKTAREQVEELIAAVPSLARVAQILDECEQDIHRFNPDTAKDGISNVRAGIEQLHGEIRGLPDRLPKSGVKLEGFKRDCMERAKAVRDWLSKKEAPPPDPKGKKDKPEKGRDNKEPNPGRGGPR
jgi:DNA repair exonuclease SbcCD ATPase subunit